MATQDGCEQLGRIQIVVSGFLADNGLAYPPGYCPHNCLLRGGER
jgi:hypothetical protein